MLSANRLSRRALPWLRPLLTAVVLLAAGCGPPPPANQPNPSPPTPPAKPVRISTLKPLDADAVRVVQVQATMPVPTATTSLTCLVVVNNISDTDRPVKLQIRDIGKGNGRPVVDTIAGQHIPANSTFVAIRMTSLHAFSKEGDYAVEAEVNGHRKAGMLQVRKPDQKGLLSIAQDVPASVMPIPSDVLQVGDTTAQVSVTTYGTGIAEDVTLDYYDMASGRQWTTSNATLRVASGTGQGPISTSALAGTPLGQPGDVEVVATGGASNGSACSSFTVQ